MKFIKRILSVKIYKISHRYLKFVLNRTILIIFFLFNYSSAQTTTFAVIGDFGSDDDHEQTVADMVNSWNPSYIITVGDNSYNGNYSDDVGKYYHQYMYPHDPNYGTSSDPSTNLFWPAVGNHDWDYGNNLSTYLNLRSPVTSDIILNKLAILSFSL